MSIEQIPEDVEYMRDAQVFAIVSTGSLGFRYGPFTTDEAGQIMERVLEENLPVFFSIDCSGHPGFDYEFARGFRDMKEEERTMDDTSKHPGTPVTQEQIDAAQGRSFVQRMRIELADLQAKIAAARAFTKSEIFAGLGENEQRLLTRQLGHMDDYADVLEERISLY